MNQKDKEAYNQAANSGRYARQIGIFGKYDNVRVYWEDRITRIFLRPFLDALVQRRNEELKRIRILDMGCGGGDGYELLMSMVVKDPGIQEYEVKIISPDLLSLYKGIDINETLLRQARERFGDNQKIEFEQGDLSKGLPLAEGEEPYDIYFTSFGTLSHLHDDEAVHLFSDIAKHAGDGALIVGDWLGRYAYEWQNLWDEDTSKEQWMDYRISYIYPKEERQCKEIDSFQLRLMCDDEILRIVERAARQSGVSIEVKKLYDRSLMVGRHIDTAEYNPNVKPLRRAINSLHEDYRRTNLQRLVFDYHPRHGFDLLNRYFENFQTSWNTLVRYTMDICAGFDEEKAEVIDPPEIPSYYPDILKNTMRTMLRVVEGSGWLQVGDSRANIIEPQLGYGLRSFEMGLQQGQGFAHGLAGIFEVKKP